MRALRAHSGVGRRFTALLARQKFSQGALASGAYLGYGTYFTTRETAPLLLRSALGDRRLDAYRHPSFLRARVEGARSTAPLCCMKTFLPWPPHHTTRPRSATLEVRVPFLLTTVGAGVAEPPLEVRACAEVHPQARRREPAAARGGVAQEGASARPPRGLRGPLPVVDELLSESQVRHAALPPREVRRIVEANLSREITTSRPQLLTLEMWHREFIDA